MGCRDGCAVGRELGCPDGLDTGCLEGWDVGEVLGWLVGNLVGTTVGATVGCTVGLMENPYTTNAPPPAALDTLTKTSENPSLFQSPTEFTK